MGRGYFFGEWAPYVSIGKRLTNGFQAARALAERENREPSPVQVTTRDIAKTFWGRSWCDNLERYSDFANRLPRGRTYLRNGSVADLVVEPGVIRALVCGSNTYQVVIKIKPLVPHAWKSIERDCAREIGSLIDLLQGKFSHAIMHRLTRVEDGLFPAKSEISMSCTCPDLSVVCKHVAATIYGVGARLDRQPDLLFKLRQVNHLDLIATATSSENLDQALSTDQGTLDTDDLGSIFGIELESAGEPAKPKTRSAKSVKEPASPAKKAAAMKTPSSKTPSSKTPEGKTPSAKTPSIKPTGVSPPTRAATPSKTAAEGPAASALRGQGAAAKALTAKGLTARGAAARGLTARGAAARGAAAKRKAATETAWQPTTSEPPATRTTGAAPPVERTATAEPVPTTGVAAASINNRAKAASMKAVIKTTIAEAEEAQQLREHAARAVAAHLKAAAEKAAELKAAKLKAAEDTLTQSSAAQSTAAQSTAAPAKPVPSKATRSKATRSKASQVES